jgi:hypothetical protein
MAIHLDSYALICLTIFKPVLSVVGFAAHLPLEVYILTVNSEHEERKTIA